MFHPWLFNTVSILVVFFAAALSVAAQEYAGSFAPLGDESENFSVEIVLSDLDNPAGLVLRAGSAKVGPHELFIAESGAGRVVRVSTDQPQEVIEVITGFAQNTYGENPSLQLGPVGLAFLTHSKLVVGGAAQQSSQGVVSVYLLPDDGSAIPADGPDHTAGPIRAGDSSASSKSFFFGLVKTDTALFITWADEYEGWILKSGIEANRLAYLQPFVTPKHTSSLGAPTGIAINPKPRPPFLVVAHRGSIETLRDSMISFYVPSSAALAMSLDTGLHDIFALAYSPTGQLYAVDFAWKEKESGGVYRLDDALVDGQQACQAVKIASIPRPTALAFAPDGKLYVTALGAKHGVLIKITGDF